MPEVDAEWIKRALIESQGKFAAGVDVEHIGSDIDRGEANVGVCFRCNNVVTAQFELVWLDGESRNDCPESEDGAPHEIDPPEGWDEE